MPRRLASPVALLVLLTVAGCGGRETGYRFDVHPVSGTVQLGGKPLPGAIVRFHAKDPAKVTVPAGQEGPPVMLTTETNPDGTFAMSTYLADDGIPAGDYTVTVAVGLAADEPSVEDGDGPRRAPRRAAPAARYRSPETSPLTATVKPGEANRFAFELE
jgi:hypothetical protein